MTDDPESVHRLLVEASDETKVRHHPMCGAHPVLVDGPCHCAEGVLAELVRAIIAIHAPHESCSVNTLGCDQHNVTRPGRLAALSTDDCKSCPDCAVTPITVCSSWGCEGYPCETIQAVTDTLSRVRAAEAAQ